jgi:transcriptional antiterminator NusG
MVDEAGDSLYYGSDLVQQIEEGEQVRGFLYQPETLLVEFEGLQADEGGSVNEAISKINRLAMSEQRFSGQASMLISEAKGYLPGERGREVIHNHYMDTEGVGYPDQSDFIELKMLFSQYHRRLLREVSGVIDFAGGDRPLAKRGAVVKPAELQLITLKGSQISHFIGHKYELYVVQTHSQGEQGVMQSLNLQRAQDEEALFRGEEVNLYVNTTRFVSSGDESSELAKKKFTGYIYVSVHLDSTSWHLIKSIPKVLGFVGGKTIEEVQPLTSQEVNTLFNLDRRRVERVDSPTITTDYQIGDVIEVTGGPFAMYIGQIQEINATQERMRIVIDKTGTSSGSSFTKDHSGFSRAHSLKVEVEFSQVKKLDF